MSGEPSQRPARPASPLSAAQPGATGRNYAFSPPRVVDRYLRSRNELSERQRNAVELLLRGLSDQDVAAQIGIDRGTVFRWRKSVAFAREMDRERRRQRERVVGRIQSLVPSAFDVLQKQLASDDPKLAMRAASILLRFATPATRLATPAASAVSAEKEAEAENKRLGDDLMAYIEAPLPGQAGAPETMAEEIDEEETDG